jgi:aspartate racemase
MKRIGIVGGLSPESTIEYYRFIIEGYRQKTKDDGAPEIIIYSLNVKQSLEMMEKKQWVAYVEWIASAVGHLADAGADFALIAANTPHMFFYEVKSVSPIPLLSIVEETADMATGFGLRKVGLLGTKCTMQSDYYQKVLERSGISVVVPLEDEQKYIHEKLLSELQFGRIVGSTRDRLLEIVQRLISTESLDGVILGCTELPLILIHDEFGIPFLNTTRIHAESAVRYSLS